MELYFALDRTKIDSYIAYMTVAVVQFKIGKWPIQMK